MRPAALLSLAAVLAACASHPTLDNLHPIPVSATPDSGGDVRGDVAAGRLLSWDEQVRLYATLVRDFFRPMGHQVRLIDPRPLARLRSADDTVHADPDFSADVARAISLRRVCPLDDDGACASLPGGVLRFSRAYASGRDTATVYVTYTPVGDSHQPVGAGAGEMRFTLARREGNWKIVSRLNAVGTNR